MASFTKEQIESALKAKSEHLKPDDIRRIAQAKDAVLKMVEEFPENWAKAKRQAVLLFDLIEASSTGKLNILPEDLKFAAGALIYLGEALDIVPDDEEDGYADDAAIIGLAISKSEKYVAMLCTQRELNIAEYLD